MSNITHGKSPVGGGKVRERPEMPFLDPERLPEVVQAVDLSRERPPTVEMRVEQVNLDVQTPVIGVKAFFANGSVVAPAFSFMMVGGVAAGVGYVVKFVAPPLFALVAMVVVFVAGLVFVDRWRGK